MRTEQLYKQGLRLRHPKVAAMSNEWYHIMFPPANCQSVHCPEVYGTGSVPCGRREYFGKASVVCFREANCEAFVYLRTGDLTLAMDASYDHAHTT